MINKPGGAGAEGLLYAKGKRGDAHAPITTLSNLFTTPLRDTEEFAAYLTDPPAAFEPRGRAIRRSMPEARQKLRART